jgi:hypothetical protein
MEDMSGRDLSWFWKGWFYSAAGLDQAIAGVKQSTDSTGANDVSITLNNLGPQVMPVELTLTLADSSTQQVKLPVEIWYFGNTFTTDLTTPKPVIKAQLWGTDWFHDMNQRNDGWVAQ